MDLSWRRGLTGEATLPLLLPASSVSGSSSARIASWIGAGGAALPPPLLPRTTPETLGSLSETGAMLLKRKKKGKRNHHFPRRKTKSTIIFDRCRARDANSLSFSFFLSFFLSSPLLSRCYSLKPAASSYGRDNNDAVVGSWC